MEEKKYQLATKAIMFASICENNFVAAAILDYAVSYTNFYRRVNDKEPFQIYIESTYGYLDNPSTYASFGYRVNVDANLLCPTIDEIRAAILPHFVQPCEIPDSDVRNALELLDRKHFLYLIKQDDEEWFTDGYFELDTIPLLYSGFLKSLFCRLRRRGWAEGISRTARGLTAPLTPAASPLLRNPVLYSSNVDAALVKWYTGENVVPPPLPVFDRARERKIVLKQYERGEQAGQAGTLTLHEWLNTLQYFQGRCAFDSQHPYQVLERFIPVSMGGGTTFFFSGPFLPMTPPAAYHLDSQHVRILHPPTYVPKHLVSS